MEDPKEQVRTTEAPDIIARYDRLKKLGKELFKESTVSRDGVVSEEDVRLAREFLVKAARETNPPVWASYWEHVLIAPELGRKLAEQAAKKGIEINAQEVEFLLWFHDIGRLVTPAGYLRNDLIGDRLLFEIGIPKKVSSSLISMTDSLKVGEDLDLSDKQLHFEEPLNPVQEQKALNYFQSLTPPQRIEFIADNMGKRSEEGIFSFQAFYNYLKTQEVRYEQTSLWPSISWAILRRPATAALVGFVNDRIVEWLKSSGVDFESVQESLSDFGPKFVIIVRHGELDNPKGIVYNRDTVMEPEDIIHLAPEGKVQMEALGNLLVKRKFKCVRITSSPEIRAQESATVLKKVIRARNVDIEEELDDSYSPGPYFEKMTMEELEKVGGNVYGQTRWNSYHHEAPKKIIDRMSRSFQSMVESLRIGEAGILVSHGDPIGWFLNKLIAERIPVPQDLRKMNYLPKGGGLVVVIDPQGRLFTTYLLTDVNLPQGKIY